MEIFVGFIIVAMVYGIHYYRQEAKTSKLRIFETEINKYRAENPIINIWVERNDVECRYYVEHLCDGVVSKEFYSSKNKVLHRCEELKTLNKASPKVGLFF